MNEKREERGRERGRASRGEHRGERVEVSRGKGRGESVEGRGESRTL